MKSRLNHRNPPWDLKLVMEQKRAPGNDSQTEISKIFNFRFTFTWKPCNSPSCCSAAESAVGNFRILNVQKCVIIETRPVERESVSHGLGKSDMSTSTSLVRKLWNFWFTGKSNFSLPREF